MKPRRPAPLTAGPTLDNPVGAHQPATALAIAATDSTDRTARRLITQRKTRTSRSYQRSTGQKYDSTPVSRSNIRHTSLRRSSSKGIGNCSKWLRPSGESEVHQRGLWPQQQRVEWKTSSFRGFPSTEEPCGPGGERQVVRGADGRGSTGTSPEGSEPSRLQRLEVRQGAHLRTAHHRILELAWRCVPVRVDVVHDQRRCDEDALCSRDEDVRAPE